MIYVLGGYYTLLVLGIIAAAGDIYKTLTDK